MIRTSDADLARARVEAILRPVRTDWAALTSDVRRLEQAAGDEWRERCAAQGELPLGSAAITDAGELAAQFVIHVAVATETAGATPRSVAAGLENGLRRAEEWEIREMAMPLLGTGPGALDPETACRVMAPLLEAFDAKDPDRRVLVCSEDPAAVREAELRWGAAGDEAGQEGG